jgi:hypothetical protein
LHDLSAIAWVQFVLAISIVFALWWLFFTIVSDRQCKDGLLNSSVFELLFIPTLIGLGMLGASFSDLFKYVYEPGTQSVWVTKSFGFSISLFLLGIWAMMSFLNYQKIFMPFKKVAKRAFFSTAVLIIVLTCLSLQIALLFHLLIVLVILIGLILYLNAIWYKKMMKNKKEIEVTGQ